MTRGPSKQFDPEAALTKAMAIFWARGYEAASLSELLGEMGIGKKSLYDTFGNKRSLFLKALAQYATETVRDIRTRLLAAGSSLGHLKQLLRDWQEADGRPGSCGCMLGNSIADFNTDDAEVAEILRGYLRQIEDVFCAAIARAQAAGEIGPDLEARDLARLLLFATQGMALLGRVMTDDTTLKSAVRAAIALLEQS